MEKLQHNKLEEDEGPNNKQQTRSEMNQDDIIEELSRQIKNKAKRQPLKIQKLLMVISFFFLQIFTLYIIKAHLGFIFHSIVNYAFLQIYSIKLLQNRLLVALTSILYLIVAFTNPGYVTSYVIKQEDDDLEKGQNNKNQKKLKNDSKRLKQPKIKKSVLTLNKPRLSRQERLQDQNSNNQSLQTQNSIAMNTQSNNQQYQVLSHLDQSSRTTPQNINGSKFIFSNMTTHGMDNQQPGEMINISLDDSTVHSSKSQLKDNKQVKVIASISRPDSQTGTLNEWQQNNSFQDIQEEKMSPFAMIARKIAQTTQKSQEGGMTSEGDFSRKTTTANTVQGKTLLIDKGFSKSDEYSGQTAFVISEEEVTKKRKLLNIQLSDSQEIEELDNESQDLNDSQRIGINQIQFDAIEEENEEDIQKEEESIDNSPQEQQQSIFHIEMKYCTVCNIEQPLRTKHCRSCNKCVATYDHHCPWVGNCIAEKNRRFFFYFLISQFIETVWALIYIIQCFVNGKNLQDWIEHNWIVLITLLIDAFFILMVGSLIIFHIFLAANNLTTWECLSWNKISYMKIWPKRYGSPFSVGKTKLQNLKLYFCPAYIRKNYFTQWDMPKQLPELDQSKFTNKIKKFCCCFYVKY